MKGKVSIKDFSDEELKDELEIRGFNVFDDYELDDRVNSLVEEVVCDDKKEEDGFFLKKDFLGYELREHLLEITGLGGWVNGDVLFNKLKELVK